MSNPPRAGEDGSNGDLEKTMAKAAGFVVFSGIAISILKALNPFNNSSSSSSASAPRLEPLSESTRVEKTLAKPTCCRSSEKPPLQQPLFQWNTPVTTSVEQNVAESTAKKAIEIVKGDTLWGLSRKYGVSIEAIKEANGLTTDTIYAGKKLTIP
ncbi:hypothetical protein C2S53_004905 [Perilla frutescens var. hirtella]|uniref:LysM domain-containing protein n=1 Tax=Perilla frutescens var. hirtella TaxID=608512 RepID=A0AAD4JHI8_PERFH|nr:hypothetical protein C2S53_004905 [Perilla frutescens var. hirtella]